MTYRLWTGRSLVGVPALAGLLLFLTASSSVAFAQQPQPNPQDSKGAKPQTHKASQKWALLIGVNDYSYINKLKYCGVDIEALAAQLEESGFPRDQIRLMTDSAKDHKYLPIRTNIETQIDLITSIVSDGDVLLLAFSGHGVSLDGKSYVCPEDAKIDDFAATMVSTDSIYDRLQRCKASLKIVLVDACRDDPRPGGKKSATDQAGDNLKFSKPLEKVPEGIVLFNSCSPGESSMEDGKLKHGVFTHYLLKGLSGEADDDHDGIVTLFELAQYTGKETKKHVGDRWAYIQRPYIKGELSTDALGFDFGRAAPKPLPAVLPLDDDAAKKSQLAWAKFLKTEITVTNAAGMKFNLIPPGKFKMGSPADEKDRVGDEDQVDVTLTEPYYIGQTEVTQAQWKAVMKDAPEPWRGKDSLAIGENLPVMHINWKQANEFCERLSKLDRKTYRLPTEAEWEFACRAGKTTAYSFGAVVDQLGAHGWFDGNTPARPSPLPQAVAHREASAWGLFDMHGNVAEWCADQYNKKLPGGENPKPTMPAAGEVDLRVGRGGSCMSRPKDCRSAVRNAYTADEYEAFDLGFRVVLQVKE